MIESSHVKVVFAIPIKEPQTEVEHDQIDVLLSLTLDSLAHQTSKSYIAVVCGHARPHRALARHPETIWLQAPFPPPVGPEHFREDKRKKRAVIAAYMKEQAPFYYMALDGDDLVHRKCVNYVLQKGRKRGVYFAEGYALDFRSGSMAAIPGVWRQKYYKVCGSSAMIYMEANDIPDHPDDCTPRLFWEIQSHPTVTTNASRAGQKLYPFPMRGGVYVLNNGVNISYEVIKGTSRPNTLSRRIDEAAIGHPMEVLRKFVDPDAYLEARSHSCFSFSPA